MYLLFIVSIYKLINSGNFIKSTVYQFFHHFTTFFIKNIVQGLSDV